MFGKPQAEWVAPIQASKLPQKNPSCYLSSTNGNHREVSSWGQCLNLALSHFSPGQRYPDICSGVSQEPAQSVGKGHPLPRPGSCRGGLAGTPNLSLQTPNMILQLLGLNRLCHHKAQQKTSAGAQILVILNGSRSRTSRTLGAG